MPKTKRHPSKDPRTIARDIARLVCAPRILTLEDIAYGPEEGMEDGSSAHQASRWHLDLIDQCTSEARAANETAYERLKAAVPEKLRVALIEYADSFDALSRGWAEAGFLLGLEVGARQSTLILGSEETNATAAGAELLRGRRR